MQDAAGIRAGKAVGWRVAAPVVTLLRAQTVRNRPWPTNTKGIPDGMPFGVGAPERIRTSDPQIRSLVLYPAELRARCGAAHTVAPLAWQALGRRHAQ